MDWSQYPHLIGAGLAAVALLCLLSHWYPALEQPSNRLKARELIALVLIVSLGIAIIYGAFYAGNSYFSYSDVGSDTSEQYVPYYINLLDNIRSGSLGFWNFEYGLGTSFMSYQSWTLDPFNVIVIPLGLLLGNSALGLILVLTQSIKILCSALLFDHVLTFYCRIPLSRILGASLLSFCGFLMLWGQHYWLGSVLVMAIAMTAALESLMARQTIPRTILVAAITASTILMSTYSGFMVMVYATIYAVLRVIHIADCHSIRDFIRAFLPLTIPVACGVLISMLTVIPYATLLLGESSRVSGGESAAQSMLRYLIDFVPLRWIPPILSRALGNGLMSIGADIPSSLIPPTDSFSYVNVYEFIQLGFSVACFILLGQFAHWTLRDASSRDRKLIIIATLFCALYCFNFFLPALFNVFVDPKYRSSFVLSIPVCTALAYGWEQRVMTRTVSKSNLIVCSVATISIILWSLINTVNGRLVCISYLLLCIIVAVGLALGNRIDEKCAKLLYSIVLACIIGSSVVDGFFVTNSRITSTEQSFPQASSSSADSDTTTALSWIKEQDEGIYRVEKLYTDWTRLNDSLIQHYSGISSYNSTLDSDVIDFYNHMWPNILVGDSAYQEFINDPDHPELLRLLGVKYILSHDELQFTWCTLEATFNSVYVYRVLGSQSLLSVRTGTVSESVAETMSPEARAQLLAASAIVPDDIAATISSMPAQTVDTTYDGATIETSQGFIVNEPHLGSLNKLDANTLQGTFSALADNSVVCLAIPNTAGWSIEVDGERVDTFRINYGFIGFKCSSGEHTVMARYAPPNAHIGILVAAAGLVTCVIYSLYILKSKQA